MVTLGIMLATVAVYVFVQLPGDQTTIIANATIPCEFTTGEPASVEELNSGVCAVDDGPGLFADKSIAFSLIASIFLHGGFAHLLGNLWSLWIFGNNVEDAFGKLGYLAFYLAAGATAGIAHIGINPESAIPVVGASGAIAGVMGAYLMLFPRARITAWAVVLPLQVPAWVFLGFWFLTQFWIAGTSPSVAWDAHLGGFIFGLVLAGVWRGPLTRRLSRHSFQFAR